MDDATLNLFSNSRKSKLSQKNFEQAPYRQSKKNIGTSKNIDSSISISKNLDEPKSSDAFSNVMKGIMDLSKRIQDKYSPASNGKIQNSMQNSSSSTNKWKMDKIKEQKHEDDDQNNYHNKQNQQNKDGKTTVGSSKKFLQTASYQPYIQRRSKSPSRPRAQGPPQNSRIVYQEPTPQIRIIPPTPPPPQPIFIPVEQPVVRRNIQQPPRFLPYPPPPPPQHHTIVSHPNPPPLPVIHPVQYPIRPPIYFNRPPPIIQYRPIIPQVIRQPVIRQPVVIKRPKIRPPYYQYYPESQVTQNNQNNLQNINNLPLDESTINIRETTQPQIVATEEDKKLMEQLKKQPNKVNMTVEELQKILQKQSNMNNNDSAQILKQLKQLTQQQKKNKITPQMLEKLKKTQKTIVKTKKITKKTTNKNSSNSKSQQSQQAALMSMMGMTNFQDMFTPQNYQNYLPMMQYFMNGNNPQMLADGSTMNGIPGMPGFPGMYNGGPSIQNGSEKKLRSPLGQIPQNIQQELGQSTGRKPHKTQKAPKQKRSKQQVDSQLLVKQKYLNQIIDNEIKRLEAIDENYETNICLNDLEQLKKTNQSESKWFLNQFDQIIHKMEKQKVVEKPDLQKKYYNTEQQPEVFIYKAGQKNITESVTQNFFSKSKDFVNGFFDHFKS